MDSIFSAFLLVINMKKKIIDNLEGNDPGAQGANIVKKFLFTTLLTTVFLSEYTILWQGIFQFKGIYKVMYITKLFLPIAKNLPSDAKIKSHQLMLMSGMIKQSSAGYILGYH